MSTGDQGQQPKQPRTPTSKQTVGVPSPDPARPFAPGEFSHGQAVRRDTGQAPQTEQGVRDVGYQASQGQQTPLPFQAPDLNALQGQVETELQQRLGSGTVLPAAAPGAPQPQQLNFDQIKPYLPAILQVIQDLLGRAADATRQP